MDGITKDLGEINNYFINNPMILNTIIKENVGKTNEVQIFNKLQVCERCGKKMVNNTFGHVSRTGGSFNCECGNSLFF